MCITQQCYLIIPNKKFKAPHTEGRWHCVKRWLPSSGRYCVEEYLPVYLWTIRHKKRKNNLFYELLKIVSKNIHVIDNTISENLVQDDDASDIVTKNTTRELYPCLYCNVSYGGIRGLKRHLHYCSKNPDAVSYTHLNKLGYTSDWVNHSENFVKPGSIDVHTETIEGRWH